MIIKGFSFGVTKLISVVNQQPGLLPAWYCIGIQASALYERIWGLGAESGIPSGWRK